MARTVYDQDMQNHLASMRKIAQTNPWFAVGDAIGSALAGTYANNYNNRGINKAVNKALEEYAQPQQNAGGVSDMDALASVRQNYGLDTPQEHPVISVGDVPQQDKQNLAAMLQPAQSAQPQTYEQTIASLAETPGASIIARDNAARDIGVFDKNAAMMRAQQQMLKDGRTPYQIEQAMKMLEPHFNRMQDDNYRLRAEQIMAELGATDEEGRRKLSDNDYKQNIIRLAELGDFGKNAANIYGRDIVSGREQWNAQQQLDRENRQEERQEARDNRTYARQVARDKQRYEAQVNNIITRGQYGYGRSTGKNNSDGSVSKDDITWADKTIKDLEEKLDTLRMENPQAQLPQGDIETYNQAMAIRSLANRERAARYNLGGNTQKDAGTGKNESTGRVFDRNNYNDQARALLGMIRANKGVLDDELAARFREVIGLDRNNANPDEMTNKVIYDLRAYRKDASSNTNKGGKGGLF